MTDGVMGTEEAYANCLKDDEAVRLLAQAARGEVPQDTLATALVAYTPNIPKMPNTSAILATIPKSDKHPGAIYRLAGDRWAHVIHVACRYDACHHVALHGIVCCL